jgi:hypothetical protein
MSLNVRVYGAVPVTISSNGGGTVMAVAYNFTPTCTQIVVQYWCVRMCMLPGTFRALCCLAWG